MRSGSRGNARGAERAAEEPHPERTCSEGGDNRGKIAAARLLPHTNNMQTLGKLLDLCHEPSAESPFSPRRR